MHHEYAVEPAAIGSSLKDFLYLFEKFGFQQGRLISRFPGKWERQVIQEAREAGVADVALNKIITKLNQGKENALIKMGRTYKPELRSWLSNALESHSERPFHAIVALDECPENMVITLDGVDADHPLLAVPTSRNISRTAVDIAEACSLLLRTARKVNIVDPYFDLRNVGGDYRGPLELMLQSMHSAGKDNVEVRIHYRDHESRPPIETILNRFRRQIREIIPEGYELQLYAWLEHDHGEDLHGRYLLCDCGGILIDAGFAAAGAQESTSFALLSESHVQELCERFAVGSTVYRQVGRAVRVKSNGESEFI